MNKTVTCQDCGLTLDESELNNGVMPDHPRPGVSTIVFLNYPHAYYERCSGSGRPPRSRLTPLAPDRAGSDDGDDPGDPRAAGEAC